MMLDDSFISTDAGNGWAAVYRLVNGRVKSHGIPHARARVTGATLKSDLGVQHTVDYADFMGQRYGYGDGIWNLTDAPIDLHQGSARRYGGSMHIFFSLVNIAELDVKSGMELTLIVPTPPGLLNQVKPQIQEAFMAGEAGTGDGVWSIQLRTDRQPRRYTIRRVIVVPEGAGAYAAYRFGMDGAIIPLPDNSGGDLLSGRVVVLDLGAGTGDTYTIFNGNVAPDQIAHATDDRAGVIHNLMQPLLGDILDAVPQARHYTTAHVDALLRAYIANPSPETATVRISGKTVNLEKHISDAIRRYAEWVSANKVDALFARGVDAILMAGGGWLYIASTIRGWYPDRLIFAPDQFRHTKSIPLYDLNGIGQLALAAAVMRSQQP
jgi:hypothetical protein